MREIKFRAWDIVNKEMCYEGHHDVSHTWVLHNKLYEPYGSLYCLMQFTGLKDKNGVEIFEGDIVKNHKNPVEVAHLFVQWDYDSYGLFDKIGGLPVREDSLSNEFEVVGNIFEHPNLLK